MRRTVSWTWAALVVGVAGSASAYSVYPARIPNGTTNSCTNCHVQALGGGPRTSFGEQVRGLRVGGYPNWPVLHALDADGDGFTNGEELGDPCGLWAYGDTPAYTVGITRPGEPNQVPAAHTNQDCPAGSSASSSSGGVTSSSSHASSSGGVGSSSSASSSASSSSSSSSSSGSPRTPCDDYCDAVMTACTGDNQQYEQRDICWLGCMAGMPDGEEGDDTGDSRACRSHYAALAMNDPDTHCERAGPGGGGVCGTACDYYCDLTEVACQGEHALYTGRADCLTRCVEFAQGGSPAATESDNVYCRIYFAAGAIEGARLFCPAAGADSPYCDEPVPEGSSSSGGADAGTDDDDDSATCRASDVPHREVPGLALVVLGLVVGMVGRRRRR